MEEIEICPPRTADYPIARNLARFYVYDMSEHAGFDFPEDGLFATHDSLANYWGIVPEDEAARWPPHWRGHAHLLRAGGHPAGFALVRQVGPDLYDMGEFFVVRKYRRAGAGARVAHAMFRRYPGRWEVREMLTNTPAQAFWRRTIGAFTNGAYTESQEIFPQYQNKEFIVQRFDSAGR
jgi:predicted acetyltransferase